MENGDSSLLGKLDAPTWSTAATAFSSAASDAAQIASWGSSCDAGDQAACDNLAHEDEAKRAWLAKLEAPPNTSGSCAVFCLVLDDVLFVANVGDCRDRLR